MNRSIYKKLVITALITAIAFGSFSALDSYTFQKLTPPSPLLQADPMLMPRSIGPLLRSKEATEQEPEPPSINGQIGSQPDFADRGQFIIRNSLLTIGGMLVLWLLNIILYSLSAKIKVDTARRSLIQYTASYLIVVSSVLAFTSLAKHDGIKAVLYAPAEAGFGGPATAKDKPTPTFTARQDSKVPLTAALVINTIIIVIMELIIVQHRRVWVELENAQLKMSQLEARHQHLKHQLQPHFLFNSLSTLKALIKTSPAEAEKYLLRLSGFLRYSLVNELSILQLAEELQLCLDYMDMQKMRFGDAFQYQVTIPQEIIDVVAVPAFSIQLLIENAIKHNAVTIQNPLQITINYDNEYIEVKNKKTKKINSEPSSAIGLKNLSERYRMLCGSDIVIMDNETEFTVKIKVLKK